MLEVGDVDLAQFPQMEQARKKLLLKAMTFYRKFLDERGDDPKVRYLVGRAHSRMEPPCVGSNSTSTSVSPPLARALIAEATV